MGSTDFHFTRATQIIYRDGPCNPIENKTNVKILLHICIKSKYVNIFDIYMLQKLQLNVIYNILYIFLLYNTYRNYIKGVILEIT